MTRALRKLFVQDFEKKVGIDTFYSSVLVNDNISSCVHLLMFLEAITWMTTSLQW